MKKKGIRSLVEIALMVAVLSIISQLAIPTVFGVPITLQIFAIGLLGYFFSTKKSIITILIYISIGALGIPVFANFGGGIFHLIGYSGGFIWGFIPLAILCSLKIGRLKIPMGIFGVFLCHFIGTLQYSCVGRVPFFTSLITMSLPYLFKDVILLVLSYFTAQALKRRLKIE